MFPDVYARISVFTTTLITQFVYIVGHLTDLEHFAADELSPNPNPNDTKWSSPRASTWKRIGLHARACTGTWVDGERDIYNSISWIAPNSIHYKHIYSGKAKPSGTHCRKVTGLLRPHGQLVGKSSISKCSIQPSTR